MGTTPDCGPHCRAETAERHESHCGCKKCHGKPDPIADEFDRPKKKIRLPKKKR
jgi:hypothetical protein